MDANRTKETGRDLITQGHEDQVKVLELILRAKWSHRTIFQSEDYRRGHYGCSTQRIGRQQESCEETKGWRASSGQRWCWQQKGMRKMERFRKYLAARTNRTWEITRQKRTREKKNWGWFSNFGLTQGDVRHLIYWDGEHHSKN